MHPVDKAIIKDIKETYENSMFDKDMTSDLISKEREEQIKRDSGTEQFVKEVKIVEAAKETSDSLIPDKDMMSDFLSKEREEQLKRETITVTSKIAQETIDPVNTVEMKEDTKLLHDISIPDKDLTYGFLTKEREEEIKRENIISRNIIISETTHPTETIKTEVETKKVYDAKPKEISFTTRQTETSYTISSKDEPKVITDIKTIIKDGSSRQVEKYIETNKQVLVSESSSKFDVSKIRTDTLGHFDIGDLDDIKKFVPKDLDLTETTEITKEQVKPVIDDILQKGSVAAAARSPIQDKDIKSITKEIVEIERRSYDAKVPHKEERRHSCISPAISLERIAESDIEAEEEPTKSSPSLIIETQKIMEPTTEMKKSDSAMKQMADNIEIIIKQASEDIDASSEEHAIDEKPDDLAGQVSVDSIIEEAVTTVEGFLEGKETQPQEVETKKEVMFEEAKTYIKERPGLVKSLSRDSGEIVIIPKKKHPRTFSVQSSPEEVEEQIYTDSESGKYK